MNLNKNINIIFAKANKINLELLSFIKNELNQKKNKAGKKFSFSHEIEIIKEEKNHKNKEQKSSDTYFNSDDDDSIDEEEESSSEMSCNEESIIDL